MKQPFKVTIKYGDQTFIHADHMTSPRQAVNDAMRLTFQHEVNGRFHDNQIKKGEYLSIIIEHL